MKTLSYYYKGLLLCGAALFVFWVYTKFSPKPLTPHEEQARAVLNATIKRTRENWYAVMAGDRSTLVEIKGGVLDLRSLPISEEESRSGVTARQLLTLGCDGFRSWTGKWSDWSTGNDAIICAGYNAVSNGGYGLWSVQIEERGGVVNTTDRGAHRFISDRDQLAALIRAAGLPQ